MKAILLIIVGLAIGVLVTGVLFKSNINLAQYFPGYNESQSAYPTPTGQNYPENTIANPTPTSSFTEIQAGGKLVFVKYQVEIPQGWTSNKTSASENQDILTLTSSDYEIKIAQDAFGGTVCAYSDLPYEDLMIKDKFDYFKQLTTKDGLLIRRSAHPEENMTNFWVCEKRQNVYQTPSKYGAITVKLPVNPTLVKTNEVDEILSSLKQIN